jgi:glyoxylase-like metal-dependent hydrolase (beta-lactamase superfamily II)
MEAAMPGTAGWAADDEASTIVALPRGQDVQVDPWLLRHLLLSIDDRPRGERDRAALEDVIRGAAAALHTVPAPPPFPPPAPLGGAAMLIGKPLWLFETNSWILAPGGPGGDCVIIDVPPEVGPLLEELERYQLHVRAVFLTHGHLDHTGGVELLLNAVGGAVPVFIHPDDLDQVGAPRGADALVARALGVRLPDAAALRPLRDAERVVVAGVHVLAAHGPGHTPGTTCYLVDHGGHQLVFTGDQLFAAGHGRGDLFGASDVAMLASVQRMLATLQDSAMILPGHGEAAVLRTARQRNRWLDGPPGGWPSATSAT